MGIACTELDPRIYDPDYDIKICKSAGSIFFDTTVASYFVKQRVDTVIVTGCVTSGCIRASVSDSFSHRFRTIVPEDCVGDYDEEAAPGTTCATCPGATPTSPTRTSASRTSRTGDAATLPETISSRTPSAAR